MYLLSTVVTYWLYHLSSMVVLLSSLLVVPTLFYLGTNCSFDHKPYLSMSLYCQVLEVFSYYGYCWLHYVFLLAGSNGSIELILFFSLSLYGYCVI